MVINQLASAVYNDIVAGLAGIVANPTISMEQLEQDIVDERLSLIKQYTLAGKISKRDLLISINCIEVDCKSLDKCCYGDLHSSKPIAHFEIPQLLHDFGDDAIAYVGSTDKMNEFKVYTTPIFKYHSLRPTGKNRPYVYIEPTPNENNMYDGFIFNAPMLKRISVVGIFKDLRQLEQFSCCTDIEELHNMSFLDSEVKASVTNKKLNYYRNNYIPPQPNNQTPK